MIMSSSPDVPVFSLKTFMSPSSTSKEKSRMPKFLKNDNIFYTAFSATSPSATKSSNSLNDGGLLRPYAKSIS